MYLFITFIVKSNDEINKPLKIHVRARKRTHNIKKIKNKRLQEFVQHEVHY